MFSKISIALKQERPARFIVSRLLRASGLWRLVTIKRGGYKLRLHPASLSLSLWVDKDSRHSDSEILRAILRPGDSFVDVGANIGYLSIEAALIVGDKGIVTALEAHPRIAGYLYENITLNKLTNVRLVNAAVGDKLGWVRFTDSRSDDENHVANEGPIVVPMITLDSLMENEAVTLLKIDVEGFERFVLLGANKLLEKTQFIYFEAWDEHFKKYGYSFLDIADLLTAKGFEIISFDGENIRTISRCDVMPTCINLLAYRDRALLEERTGWRWK